MKKYTPGEYDQVIPVLSTDEGWMENKQLLIQQVFTNYVATYHGQSNMYKDDIRSLMKCLINTNLDNELMSLKDNIKSDLLHLYEKYYSQDEIDVEVNVIHTDDRDNTVQIVIDVSITDPTAPQGKIKLSQVIEANNGGKVRLIPHIKNKVIYNGDLTN